MSIGININDPRPLYEQIEHDILFKIQRGDLQPGDSVGSHTELSKSYKVSSITVRKALTNLVKEGVYLPG